MRNLKKAENKMGFRRSTLTEDRNVQVLYCLIDIPIFINNEISKDLLCCNI